MEAADGHAESAEDDNEAEAKTTIPTGLPPALLMEGLTCSHDSGTVYQLKDVSYILPRTRKIGLVGRNGCGKSTLMQNTTKKLKNSPQKKTNRCTAFR